MTGLGLTPDSAITGIKKEIISSPRACIHFTIDIFGVSIFFLVSLIVVDEYLQELNLLCFKTTSHMN